MKKILAILLSVVLLLGCAAATAEETGKTTIGTISINGAFTLQCGLPEGYQVKPILLNRDHVIARLESEDETKPVMMLSVAFDETYSDVHRMNELDEEARQLLEKTFTDMDPTIEISYGETGLGTELLIAKQTYEDYNYIDFLSIYEGYFVEFVMTAPEKAEDKTLTEDQLRMCIDFLTDLDFVPVTAGGDSLSVAGKTFTAVLTGYAPETQTTSWTLWEPIVFPAEDVERLTKGDELNLGGMTEEDGIIVDTVVTDEYGDVIVNDEIDFRKQEDGTYRAYQYEAVVMKTVGTAQIVLDENGIFLDGIDPETGDILEEPVRYVGSDLGNIIAAEGTSGVGFATSNVQLTFNEDGEAAVIERFYVPWQ